MLRTHAESTAPTADVIGPFEYRFTPRSRIAIRVARNVVGQWLRAQPAVDLDGVDDLLVALSELCTNAVQHATGGEGCVAVRGRVSDDAVVLEVEDDGEGFDDPGPIEHDELDHGAERGRGLFIVKSLVDDIEFERRPGRMIVRICKDGMLRADDDPADVTLSHDFQRD
jgi:serine/threonine-protein kinase RsbW